MTAARVDLLLAGNLLVDDVVFGDGTTRMAHAGGALLHAALAASACGLSVGCASVVGSDYPADALDLLRARGVSLDGVRALDRPGVRAWLLHEDGARRMVLREGRPSHAQVSPAPRRPPLAWRAAPFTHVAPMPFGAQSAPSSRGWGRAGAFLRRSTRCVRWPTTPSTRGAGSRRGATRCWRATTRSPIASARGSRYDL